MMPNPQCQTCRFAETGETSPVTLKRALLCHYNPPQMMLVPMPGGVGLSSHWIQVTPESWCGRHEPKLEVVS